MPQHLIQEQQLKTVQQQRLTAQQMLQVKLLEMPIAQLEQAINAEIDDNPALDTDINDTDDQLTAFADEPSADKEETFEEQTEREERADALDQALDNIDSDDRMPDYQRDYNNYSAADYEEMVYGDTVSFYDFLKEQMGEQSLNDQQRYILEYLIGSLDDDGILRKDLQTIADELAIYHNVDVEEKEIATMLNTLQGFDPAGIGARSLQECLLLQVDRRISDLSKGGNNEHAIVIMKLIRRTLSNYFDAFKKKHWKKIADSLHADDDTMAQVIAEIKRLNPRPGAALGETMGRSLQQITPDFIVDTNDNGDITISLNSGNIPPLTIASSFTDMVDDFQRQRSKLSKSEREAYKYARNKVEKAQGFIEALRQRQQNMLKTMRTIVKIQHKFFADGDEAEIVPMVLKDVAELSGLDISTISRVSNLKYVQTRWGIFPLRSFYNEGYLTESGTELSTKIIKMRLKEIIDKEDKNKPLSDDALKDELQKSGYPIARRTVAKYREQLGLPVARMRKV